MGKEPPRIQNRNSSVNPAHQKAASHGFTFPFTPLYDMEHNDDFQRPHFKIKMETTSSFLFFFWNAVVNMIVEQLGAAVSLSRSHVANLF